MEEKVDAYRDRIFSPLITLSAFLSQVLSSDHSCNNAVAKVITERVAQGEAPCSSNNKSYCNARMRLSEVLVRRLMHDAGILLHLPEFERSVSSPLLLTVRSHLLLLFCLNSDI